MTNATNATPAFALDLSVDDARLITAALPFVAPANDGSPILAAIRIEPTETGATRVLATDRYVAFHAVIDAPITGDGSQFEAKPLVEALKAAVKAKAPVSLTVDSAGKLWSVTGTNGVTYGAGATVTGNYPPLVKLYPSRVEQTPLANVKAEYWARLDKVRTALGIAARDAAPWLIATRAATDAADARRARSIIAARGRITVLFQPNRFTDKNGVMTDAPPATIGYGLDIDASGAVADADARVESQRGAAALKIVRAARKAVDNGYLLHDVLSAVRYAAIGLTAGESSGAGEAIAEALPYALMERMADAAYSADAAADVADAVEEPADVADVADVADAADAPTAGGYSAVAVGGAVVAVTRHGSLEERAGDVEEPPTPVAVAAVATAVAPAVEAVTAALEATGAFSARMLERFAAAYGAGVERGGRVIAAAGDVEAAARFAAGDFSATSARGKALAAVVEQYA